jgi:hypothetical protein
LVVFTRPNAAEAVLPPAPSHTHAPLRVRRRNGLEPANRVLGTVALYLYLAVRDRETATESAVGGLRRFGSLVTLVVAALMLASAIGSLVPGTAVRGLLGEAAGARGVVLAGVLGGLLPGGPYAVYPIVSGVADQETSLAPVVAMPVSYGARLGVADVGFESRTSTLITRNSLVLNSGRAFLSPFGCARSSVANRPTAHGSLLMDCRW